MDSRTTQGVPKTRLGFPWSKILDAAAGSSVAQGDILYRGASLWQRLSASTAGRILATAGAGADPSWATIQSLSSSTYAIYAASDQSKTSDAVLAADNALFTTLLANSKYRIRFDVVWDTSVAPDLNYDLNFTGTTTSVLARSHSSEGTTSGLPTGQSLTAFTLHGTNGLNVARALVATGTTTFFVHITVGIETGASGGTFSLRWAQNSSSPNATTRRRNSSMFVTECS